MQTFRMIYLIAISILASVLLVTACTDKTKDNPTRPTISEEGFILGNSASRYFPIFKSTVGNSGFLAPRIYLPPGYDFSGSGRPYPILYMFGPFQGDERYFFQKGLKQVADRLISEGRIQPMIIACIDGRSPQGASFFTNSLRQGNYFDAMFYDTVPVAGITSKSFKFNVEDWWLEGRILEADSTRGICGIGMGGYGAMLAAINTGLFGSVSAVNAPLDFDGVSGNGGWLSLFQKVYPPGTPWYVVDTTSTGRIDTTYAIDTAQSNPEATILVSAAEAFAPQVTGVTTDSLAEDQFGALQYFYTVTDSLTDDFTSYLPIHECHVPVTPISGNYVNNAIWGVWLSHSIDSVYLRDEFGFAAQFKTIPKLLLASDEARFNYKDQMDGFVNFAASQSIIYTYEKFSGSDLLAGTANNYMYDLLERILIFHSENFAVPPEIESSK